MRVEAGELERVIILMPPRHGKSLTSTIFFPAWFLGRNPDKYVISASYGQDLAEDFGQKVRNHLQDPLHRMVFPQSVLSGDSQAKDKFTLTEGGMYFAVGRGSAITGRGAHCLPAGTLVETDHGPLPIETLANRIGGVRVLSFNERTRSHEYKAIEAVSARPAARLRRITTAAGRVVEATGDHPFFVGGRYVEADQLAAGDRLLCAVREQRGEGRVRDREAREARPRAVLLQPRVLEQVDKRGAARHTDVFGLRPTGTEGNGGWLAAHSVLQPRVFADAPRAAEGGDASKPSAPHLRAVQHGVHGRRGALPSADGGGAGDLLLPALRGPRALAADVGRWEPEVEGRHDAASAAAALREGVPHDAPAHQAARRIPLRGLPRHEAQAARAPHRREPDEQRGVESGDALLAVPHGVARGEGFDSVEDAVALVEDVHGETVVFDLQVADNHNFYANGVLTHNCFLIDDPVKTREEASSETLRRQLHDWFSDVAYTRLMPGKSAVVLTQTLWHEDDLAGWIQREQQHDGWHIVRFPAIAEEDEERRKAGEPLWPEKFPLDKLEGIKRTLRTESWLSLYQQRCVSDDGSYFKLAWLRDAFEPKDYTPAEARGFAKYILVDPATSKKRGSDYTAMWVLGLGADRNFYVLDAVRDKLDLRERADKLFELHQRWKPITRVYYEQYALSGDIPYIKEKMNGFGGSPPYRFNITTVGGNVKKTERIGRLVPLMRDHRIRMPRHLWRTCEGREVDLVKLFEEELKAFPVAAHEDMLDSLARITDPEDADHNQLVLEWPKTPDELQAQSQMAMRDKANRGGGWMAA